MREDGDTNFLGNNVHFQVEWSSEDHVCVWREVCLSALLDEDIGQNEEPSVHSFCQKV